MCCLHCKKLPFQFCSDTNIRGKIDLSCYLFDKYQLVDCRKWNEFNVRNKINRQDKNNSIKWSAVCMLLPACAICMQNVKCLNHNPYSATEFINGNDVCCTYKFMVIILSIFVFNRIILLVLVNTCFIKIYFIVKKTRHM